MLFKSLYRYVFGQWDNLSDDEMQAIPEYFKAFDNKNLLGSALKEINANTLYKILFTKPHKDVPYHLANDDKIKKAYKRMEEQFNYGTFYAPESYATYKAYYQLCELVEQLCGNACDTIGLHAYKLLIVYGGETNLESALGLFDKDYHEKYLSLGKNGISEGLAFSLRESKTQQSLNLTEWRRILQEGNKEDNMKLFYIAQEIEMSFGCIPRDIKQALCAANAIDYARRASFPAFAGLCESAFIPEAFFDACILSDKEKRMDARKNSLLLLPRLKRVDFINALPKIGFDFQELTALLHCLKADEHLVFIERFTPELISSIKKLQDLRTILDVLSSAESQRMLVSMLSLQVISSMITEHAHLDFIISAIRAEYRYAFLESAVGHEKINTLISNGNDRLNLLAVLNLVDESDRLQLIQNVITIENVREVMQGFFHKEMKQKILALLPANDRPLFLLIVPTEKEKLVLQAKQRIINTNFPLGIMGMGMSGCNITLDNGKKKAVPETVAEIWKLIQLAEKYTVTFDDAWDKMQLLAFNKANQKASTLTYLSQSNETVEFYKSFELSEKKTSHARCNI